MMGIYAILAEGFRYPGPDYVLRLYRGIESLPPGEVRDRFAAFRDGLRGLSLGEQEELYTRTWDLSPLAAPYLGFQIWGEDYRRGKFMASLQAACRESGVALEGELPDHLLPVLRYLDRAVEPIAELEEILLPALEKLSATLKKRDPGNPYNHLLAAVQAAVRLPVKEEKPQ